MKKIYLCLIAFFMLGTAPLSAQNTDGKEFWVTFGRNVNPSSANNVNLQLRIVSKDGEANGIIKFHFNNTEIPFQTVNKVFQIDITKDLPSTYKNCVYNDIGTASGYQRSKRSIQIISNSKNITAYAFTQNEYSSDATNLLPKPVLDTVYYQISYKDFNSSNRQPDAYAVIATEDNTLVKEDGVEIPQGLLAKGEVYYKVLYSSSGSDMTGARITANHPVAFFTLHLGPVIYSGTSGSGTARDCFMQQLAPVKTWGKNFFVPVTHFGASSDGTKNRVRIVASEPDTKVTIKGGVSVNTSTGNAIAATDADNEYTLNKGSFIEREVTYNRNGCFIEAEKPVGVCTYLTTSHSTNNSKSDPSIAWLPSTEQLAVKALIAPFKPASGSNSKITDHRSLIILNTSAKADLKINGVASTIPASSWRDNTDAGMSFASYTLNPDLTYQFENPNGLIVMGFGFGSMETYYYLGYSAMNDLGTFFEVSDGGFVFNHGSISDQTFCSNSIQFEAKIVNPFDSLQWFIDDNYLFTSETADPWYFTFLPREEPYSIKMKVFFSLGDEQEREGYLKIGASITAVSNNEDWGTVTVTNSDNFEEDCFEYNAPATLTATPISNEYRFDHWEDENGDVYPGTESLVINAIESLNLKAVFRDNTVEINVNISPTPPPGCVWAEVVGGFGPNNNTFAIGDNCHVEVFVTNPCCYYFDKWTDNLGTGFEETAMSFDFTVTEDRTLTANFTKYQYTISTDVTPAGSGSVTGGGTYGCGDTKPLTPNPATGYHFVEWLENDIPMGSDNPFNVLVDEDHTYVARFDTNTYNINFSANPPTYGDVPANITDIKHFLSTLVTAISSDSCDFVNWKIGNTVVSTDESFTLDILSPYFITHNSTVNLVANFKLKEYLVTLLEEPDNTTGTTSGGGLVTHGNSREIRAFPKPCFTFIEWTDEHGGFISDEAITYITVRSPLTLVAHFAPREYQVNVTASPTDGGTVTGSGTFLCHATCQGTAEPSLPLFKFSHWEDDGMRIEGAGAIYDFTVEHDHNFVAVFVKEKVVIEVIAEPENTGSVFQDAYYVALDSLCHVSAEPINCYSFTKWTTSETFGSYTLQTVNPDYTFKVLDNLYDYIEDTPEGKKVTLVAHFRPNTFEVSIEPYPAGGGDVLCNGSYSWGSFSCGEIIEIKAIPKSHYEFSHWIVNGVVNNDWPAIHTIVIDKKYDLTAVFVLKKYEIILEADPEFGGTFLWGDNSPYEYGTLLTVEAIAGECHTFSHWTENNVLVGSLPELTFTVTVPRHLVAHFISEMFNIAVSADPPEGGAPTGGGTIPCKSPIIVKANPDDCYDFAGWFENDIFVSNSPDFDFTVEGDRELVAKYVRKLFNITTSVDPVVAPPGSGYIEITGGGDTDIPCGETRTIEAIAEIGYMFTHWTINGENETDNPYIIPNVTKDYEIVAHFEPFEHEIILYKKPTWGGQVKTGGTYPHGFELTVHAIPNPEYVFREWTEDDIAIPGAGADYTFKVERPRILTAHFDTATFTVTTSADPIDGGTTEGDLTNIPYDSLICVTAWSTDECFEFDYWSIDGVWQSGDFMYWFHVKQNCHLVAHYKKKTYKINLLKNPPLAGTAVCISGSCDNVPCGDVIIIKATPFTNYNFVNWTNKMGGEHSNFATCEFTVTNNDSLTANFELKKFDVIVSVAPGGGGIANKNHIGVEYGSYVDIHAIPDPGYKFLYWKEFGETEVYSSKADIEDVPVLKPLHLVAYFEPETYRIQLITNPGDYAGTVWGDPDGEYFPFGTYFTAHALETPPYFTWDRWTDEDNNTIEYIRNFGFNVTESRILIAHFTTVSFNIEVTANNDMGGTVDGAGEYDYGMTIPITAIPNLPCYKFTGWYENDEFVSDDNPYMVNVDGPHHFVAHFEENHFNINTSVVGNGHIEVSGGDTLDIICGTTRTVEAIADLGYVFDKWTINGAEETDNPLPLVVEEDLDVVAHFLYKVHKITVAPSPGYGGNPTGGGFYPNNTPVNVQAKQNVGFMFVKWMEEDTVILGAGANFTFNALKNRDLVAVYDSAKYTVTTASYPGTFAGTTTPLDTTGLNYQALLTVQAVASENYTFKHWMENEIPIQSAPATYKFPVTNNRDLVAVFEPKKYTVTVGYYPPGSGTVSGGGYNKPYNSTVPLYAKANENYNFYHWENEQGLPVYYMDTVEEHLVTKTEHLTAIFSPKKYDLLVSVSPGSSGYGTACCSHFDVPYPETRTIKAEPNEGYMFAGWWENDENYVNSINPWTVSVTGNRHLVARFVKGTYHIVLKANPQKGGKVKGGGFNFEYGDIIPIEAIENSCYNFESWTNEKGETVESNMIFNHTVIKSDTLTANFSALTSKIALHSEPVGIGILTADGKNGGGEFAQCDTIVISAEPTTCYTFDYWTVNGAIYKTTPSFEFAMDENNHTFVAHFTQKQIDVSVKANPEEGGLASGGVNNLPCGDEITLTAIANDGYHFVNWTLNGEALSSEDIFLYSTTETGEVIANFAKNKYTITVAASPPDCGAVSGGGNFDYETEITVKATAKTGYMFVNWTEDGREVSTSANYTFTVTGDRNLTANFETTFHLVTVLSNDTLYGLATIVGFPAGVGKFTVNDIATVVANVKQGYRFLYWTIDDVVVSYKTEFDFTVTQDITLTAHFYGLDFDTYVATLWENTFLLDLKKLTNEGLDVTGCRWFKVAKNSVIAPLVPTNTIDEFSYSAGPKITDKLDTDPTSYYFQITTQKGILYSTKKVLPFKIPMMTSGNNSLFVYPNPAESGMMFTVENAIPGTLLQVYNQFGVCVKSVTAADSIVTLSLNLPTGIYLIRNENKETKLIITK